MYTLSVISYQSNCSDRGHFISIKGILSRKTEYETTKLFSRHRTSRTDYMCCIFIKLLLPFGVEYAAGGAMFSVILGEFASLLYMIFLFKRTKKIKIRYRFFSYLKSSKDTLKELFSIALPSTGSRMIGSFTNFLEPIL